MHIKPAAAAAGILIALIALSVWKARKRRMNSKTLESPA